GHYLKDVRFIGNTISGGYYNMYLYYASSSTSDMSKCLITIDSNTLVDAYCYGIYATYSKHTGISHNTITLRASSATQYGIYTNYTTLNDGMIGNKIQLNSSTTSYGIRLYYINAYAANGLAVVANNEVVHNGSGGTSYGMYCYYNNAYIYHNTVYLIGSNTSYPLYIGTMSSSYQMIIKNNIFATYSSGTAYALRASGVNYVLQSYGTYLDYNNYYSSGSDLAYIGAALSSLSDLQTATGQDQHSTNLNPNFINTNDLRLTSYDGFECPRMLQVHTDIRNYLRRPTTNMGAYVKDPSDIDVELLEFIGFSTAYASGASFPIQVVIRNAGFTPLSAATIRAKVNGVEITPIAYTSTIPLTYAEADTVSIGSFIFTPGINTILATATLTGDTLHENDTIKDSRFMCTIMMGGQYVIGASASADYPSFDSLMVDVLRCGINSNLSLKYESGTYAENWDLSNLSNIMGGYTLTISSLSGNRNSVIIRPSSGVAITLNNTHNLIVKDITIDNRGSIAYGVEFAGSATNIEFRNIYFMGDTLGTTAANAPAPIYKASSADLINDIRIIGNVIEGGYYGIYLYGGNSSSAYGTNVVIDSNIMRNQYYYANYFYYVDFNSISHNTMLSRRTSTNTYWYGIRSYYCNFVADGNKIHQRSTAITSPYLVYIYYAGYYNASQPSLFCNNELIGSSSTTYYAMYLGTYNVLNVYNNSIYMDGTGASRCIYIASSTSSSFDFKNNIIVNASSSGHVVYFAGTTTPCISDYNCLYSPGNIGYFSSSYTTLAAWQSATGTDAHSISVNPSFVDVSSSLELLDYRPFVVPMLTDITKDIQGNIRTSFTMMGAYSLALYEGYNLAITEIIGLKEVDDIHCFPDYETIQVVLSNNGTQDYDFSVNSIHVRLEINGAIHYQKDTLINGGSLLALRKDTIELGNMIPVSTLGAYYITVYVSSNVDTLYVDDTLRTNYNVHKIAMPYDEDFSTRPPEFVFKQILGAVNWEVQSGTGSNPTIAPVFGTGRLHFASESGAGSIAQAIINGIDLRGSNQPTLEFWFAHDNTSYNNDLMEIKVSTDGGATTQTLRTVYRYHAWYPTPGWEHIVIDLSAYTQESCLSLIFEASSFGGGNQNIDRIRIASKPDVAISLIAPKEEDLVACKTSNQRLKVVVSNMTTQYVDFDQDTTQIVLNVSGADVVTYTYPLSGQLAGLSSDTLEITQTFDMSNNGTYDLIAYIEAIDSNFVNDTSKATIQINNDLSIDKVVGVDAVNCKKIGDSVYVSFTVYNLGNLVVDEIPLSLQINGVNVIVDTVYTSLMPGDSLLYDFTEAYVVPVVTYIQPYYFVKVQTQLACDAANANNIREIMACVDLPEIVDLQIQTVNKPLETVCDTGLRTVYVSVTLANEGTSDISSAVLHVEIDSAGTPWASFSETTDAIPSEGTTTHIFSQGYIVPNFTGNYIVRVYVDSLPADENLTNDSLEILACAILDDVSIDAFGQVSWTMEQNIPNPARTNTRIPYAIPQEGAILFKVMSINGQVLYTKEIDAMAGSHSMEFDITTLSNGIYYYSMEYQGQRIVKKMTIQK
ncbi:MAG: T9SS type A sorting domain-containing protein, partial [Bacteroidales bacterium]|nr:T9SS type A sorting domain-containing protein [Bacteroidales bacterium]